jgi:hypothetical protein
MGWMIIAQLLHDFGIDVINLCETCTLLAGMS